MMTFSVPATSGDPPVGNGWNWVPHSYGQLRPITKLGDRRNIRVLPPG